MSHSLNLCILAQEIIGVALKAFSTALLMKSAFMIEPSLKQKSCTIINRLQASLLTEEISYQQFGVP